MSIKSFFFNNQPYSYSSELPSLYPFGLEFQIFVKNDIKSIYSKILTDVIDRTQGLNEDIELALWDNCLANEASKGLITMLSEAMCNKSDLYLVYSNTVLRQATSEEAKKIREDYKTQSYSDTGIYVSFSGYKKTDMLKIYSEMEYSILNSLNKKLNISSAMQFKMTGLRESVANVNSDPIVTQAKTMVDALREGKNILMDQNDNIEMAIPDLESTKQSIAFLDSKRAFYLNLPISYITGALTSGIGSTGESDVKATERGLRGYYVSIIKPVLENLFGIKVTYKSQDFRMINTALEAVKTFELISDDYIDAKQKQLIINKLLDFESVY